MPEVQGVDVIKSTIDTLGDKLSKTLDDFKVAEGGERDKLAKQIQEIKVQVDGLSSALKAHESRPNFSNVEVTKMGEKNKFSLGRAFKLLYGLASPDDKEYGYEMEVHKLGLQYLDSDSVPQSQKTAINASTGSAGGFLLPTTMMPELIPELEAMEIAPQLGATVINGLSGSVNWTKDKGGITAYYVDSEAEEAITESVATFDVITMKDHVLAALVPLTNKMLKQSTTVLDQWIPKRLAKKLALREDKSFFLGTGVSSEPKGVFNWGVNSFTWGSTVAVDFGSASTTQTVTNQLIEMLEKVVDSNVNLGAASKLAWAMSTKVLFALGQVKDSDGYPIFMDMKTSGVPTSILGYPVKASTQLKASALTAENIIFGDWSEAWLGRWDTIAFAASDQTSDNFAKLKTSVRAVMSHDVAVMHDLAFCKGASVNVDSVI